MLRLKSSKRRKKPLKDPIPIKTWQYFSQAHTCFGIVFAIPFNSANATVDLFVCLKISIVSTFSLIGGSLSSRLTVRQVYNVVHIVPYLFYAYLKNKYWYNNQNSHCLFAWSQTVNCKFPGRLRATFLSDRENARAGYKPTNWAFIRYCLCAIVELNPPKADSIHTQR